MDTKNFQRETNRSTTIKQGSISSDWAIITLDIRRQQNKTSTVLRGHDFYSKFLHLEKF